MAAEKPNVPLPDKLDLATGMTEKGMLEAGDRRALKALQDMDPADRAEFLQKNHAQLAKLAEDAKGLIPKLRNGGGISAPGTIRALETFIASVGGNKDSGPTAPAAAPNAPAPAAPDNGSQALMDAMGGIVQPPAVAAAAPAKAPEAAAFKPETGIALSNENTNVRGGDDLPKLQRLAKLDDAQLKATLAANPGLDKAILAKGAVAISRPAAGTDMASLQKGVDDLKARVAALSATPDTKPTTEYPSAPTGTPIPGVKPPVPGAAPEVASAGAPKLDIAAPVAWSDSILNDPAFQKAEAGKVCTPDSCPNGTKLVLTHDRVNVRSVDHPDQIAGPVLKKGTTVVSTGEFLPIQGKDGEVRYAKVMVDGKGPVLVAAAYLRKGHEEPKTQSPLHDNGGKGSDAPIPVASVPNTVRVGGREYQVGGQAAPKVPPVELKTTDRPADVAQKDPYGLGSVQQAKADASRAQTQELS